MSAGELLAFTDAEALRALEIVLMRRPRVVALERLFAATPRGAALINRIKADPTLVDTEIRVISHDSDHMRVSARLRRPDAEPVLLAEDPPDPQTLDQRGTRRAPRFKMAGTFGALLDGNAATRRRPVDDRRAGRVAGSAEAEPGREDGAQR